MIDVLLSLRIRGLLRAMQVLSFEAYWALTHPDNESMRPEAKTKPRRNLPMLMRKSTRILLLLIVGMLLCRTMSHAVVAKAQPEAKPLHAGLMYQQEMFAGSEVHLCVIDLFLMKPAVLVSEHLPAGAKLSELVRKEGVIAAVNAHFFDSAGPQGMLVSPDRRSGPRHDRSSLSFYEDGTYAKIGLYRLGSNSEVATDGGSCLIKRYNESYSPGGIGVYTNTASGVGIVPQVVQARVRLDPNSEQYAWTGYFTEVVDRPQRDLVASPGEIILSAGNEASVASDLGVYAWAKQHFKLGVRVTVRVEIIPKPAELVISGAPEFLRNGIYFIEENGNERLKEKTARTAVGITSSGSYLLVAVVEGQPKMAKDRPETRWAQLKQGHMGPLGEGLLADGMLACRSFGQYTLAAGLGLTHISQGMSVQDMARYMSTKEVAGEPIVSAINLDGGSSSTMVHADPFTGEITVVNDLMDGEEVEVATGLGFVPRN